MQTTTFLPGKFLLACTIATAAFFTTLIFLDYGDIETNLIAASRELLLIPFFLMLLLLPFFIFISMYKKKYHRSQLLWASVVWVATLMLVVIKTFFLP
jgi:hypothetical protein